MGKYTRIRLGQNAMYAEDCAKGNFVGIDYGLHQDLSNELPDSWREFNKRFIPVLLAIDSTKTKVGAGLNCGMMWTVAKGIDAGAFVICPDPNGTFLVGKIVGPYYYATGEILPHRRPVEWFESRLSRDQLSESLWKSMRGPGTSADISGYAEELDALLSGKGRPAITSSDPDVEDASNFALEKHLEDFLVTNWNQTELAKTLAIFSDQDGNSGQQYPTDTGPIDILAISHDNSELVVIELKKGRASDMVVGQIQRYMGYVQEELVEPNQRVRGVIIALEDDIRIRRALSVTNNIEFYRYEVNFKLFRA